MKKILMAATLLVAGISLAQERTIYNDFVTFQQAQSFWPDLKKQFVKTQGATFLAGEQSYSSTDLSIEAIVNFDSFNQSQLLEQMANDLSSQEDPHYFTSGNDGVGNGGGSWVCLEENLKTIRWSKMVDLDEAENEILLNMKDFGKRSTQEIVDLMKVRLFLMSKVMYNAVLPYLSNVQKMIKEVDRDLVIIDDALVRSTPPKDSCENGTIKYVQLANYTDYGAILVNKRLFTDPKLNDVSKAALIWHEAIYAFMREQFGESNSLKTRAIVGHLFSDLPNDKLLVEVKKFIGPFTFEDTNRFGMKFSYIPAGNFVMGSPESEETLGYNDHGSVYPNENQHDVTIEKSFLMMTTEVTQEQWEKVMGSNPSRFKGPKKPVENFSDDEMFTFIDKLNQQQKLDNCKYTDRAGCYRLPTNEEWEYAARAGTQTTFYFGNDSSMLDQYAWYKQKTTQDVGQNKANNFGLYDMYGNVDEWVIDKKRTGDSIYRDYNIISRGGSFYDRNPLYFRSARQRFVKAIYKSPSMGLRLVRVIRNNVIYR